MMKTYFIAFFLVAVTAATGCKKDKQGTGKKVVVTTIAGEGTADSTDGPALSAKFNAPTDVAITTDEAIYVADYNNHRIRKIVAGQVSSFAGNSISDIVNENGVLAQFKSPYNIASDANGNLYTSDGGDPRIRKISPAATVSTHAGTATPGFENGAVTIAQFQTRIGGIVADGQGNIYVADGSNHRIRKISISGQVTTIAGTGTTGFNDGSGTMAQFNRPFGITIDRQGNLYVAERTNLRIRKIVLSADGTSVVSTLAGSGTQGEEDGAGVAAQFFCLGGIVIDSQENLYVVDYNRIRKISPQGIVSTIAGSSAGYIDGDGASAKFRTFGAGLAIDPWDNIYVADTDNNRIRKISFE